MSRSALASLQGIREAEVRRNPLLRSQVDQRDLRFLLLHELVSVDRAVVRTKPAARLVLDAYQHGVEDRTGSAIAALVVQRGASA